MLHFFLDLRLKKTKTKTSNCTAPILSFSFFQSVAWGVGRWGGGRGAEGECSYITQEKRKAKPNFQGRKLQSQKA